MILDRVTLTGADNSVNPEELIALSYEFPFVEWGILVGTMTVADEESFMPRYPSRKWIYDLLNKSQGDPRVRTSLHVCGYWVRQLLLGNNYLPHSLHSGFPRIQLNFHAEKTKCDKVKFCKVLQSLGNNHEFIFQVDGNGGNDHLYDVWDEMDRVGVNLSCVPLFDVSGGAGITPEVWPAPIWMKNDKDYVYHGYAGGLGPDNVLSELERISEVAGSCRIWIDMETKIRTSDNLMFDLSLCREVLTKVRSFGIVE